MKCGLGLNVERKGVCQVFSLGRVAEEVLWYTDQCLRFGKELCSVVNRDAIF